MRIFSFVFCLFLISSFCAFAQTSSPSAPVDANLVSITTDKTLYKLGEEVKVTVLSRSQERVEVNSYSEPRCQIARSEEAGWKVIPISAGPCDESENELISPLYLEPGKPYQFSWQQHLSWCEGKKLKEGRATLGTYCVECHLSTTDENNRSSHRFTVASKDFVIEK